MSERILEFSDAKLTKLVSKHENDEKGVRTRYTDKKVNYLKFVPQRRGFYFRGRGTEPRIGEYGIHTIQEMREKAIEFARLDTSSDIKQRVIEDREEIEFETMTLNDAVKLYVEKSSTSASNKDEYKGMIKRTEQKNKNYPNGYKITEGAFYFMRDKVIIEITEQDLLKGFDAKTKEGHAPQANKALRNFKSLFSFCAAYFKVSAENPGKAFNKRSGSDTKLHHVQPKRTTLPTSAHAPFLNALREVYNDEEVDIVRRRQALMAEIIMFTGLRSSEVRNMKWNWLIEGQTMFTLPKEIAKNKRPIDLPFPEHLLEPVDRIGSKQSDYMFAQKKNPNKPIYDLRWLFEDHITEELNIKVRPHDLRRNFITVGRAETDLIDLLVKYMTNHATEGKSQNDDYVTFTYDLLADASKKISRVLFARCGIGVESKIDAMVEDVQDLSKEEKMELLKALMA